MMKCAACGKSAIATLRASNGPELYGTCTSDRDKLIAGLLFAGAGSVQITLLVRSSGLEAGRYERRGVRR